MSISVLIADDDPLARVGIRMMLQGQQDIRIVDEVGDPNSVLRAARIHRPEVVLMDVEMPSGTMGGLDAIPKLGDLLCNPCRVLVLTVFINREDYVYQALHLGASGFLPKATSPENLIHAIRVVAGGEAVVFPETIRLIETHSPAEPDASVRRHLFSNTSEREREVLSLLARGKSILEIAEALFIADATVKTHIQNMKVKVDVRDRIQLVVMAYVSGLVRPGE